MERYCFDTSVLVHLLSTSHNPGNDHIPHKQERLKAFLTECDQHKDEVLVPTPVLSELLVGISQQDMPEIVSQLNGFRAIQIVPFDQSAAIEYAIIFPNQRELFSGSDQTKRIIKFDSMILAMCSRHNVSCLIANDGNMKNKAQQLGIAVKTIQDLPIPDNARQGKLDV